MKGAKSTYTATRVLATAGGAMIGWLIGTAIGGGEPNCILAGVGVGLVTVSIPLSSKFNKQSKAAVDIFYGSLTMDRHIRNKDMRLVLNGNGVGMRIGF